MKTGEKLRRLVIVSGSKRLLKNPKASIPALERINAVFLRPIKKYIRDNPKKAKNLDVLILLPSHGLIKADEKMVYEETIAGEWDNLRLDPIHIAKKRDGNLQTLKGILNRTDYDEIYVNVGAYLLKLIEGFDKFVSSSVTIVYSKGKGLGPKMADMKEWLNK